MPRFVGNPIIVEAHQYLGGPTDLPPLFGASLTQHYMGEKAFLPSTAIKAHAEEEISYAIGDVVNFGDWIVLGMMGLYRMSPAEFERAFTALDDPACADDEARWQATYIGANDGSTPTTQHWLGYRFDVGRPIGIHNPDHAALIGGNAHFIVEDTQNAADGDAVGSEGASQAGDFDRGGILGAGGRDHLDLSVPGDASAAGDRGDHPGSELAGTVTRRGPGRPRREDHAGRQA